MKIAFIRHGDIRDPADFYTPITDLGIRQSILLGKSLAGMGFKRLLSSLYARCVNTAEIISEEVGLYAEYRRGLVEVGWMGEASILETNKRLDAELKELTAMSTDIIVVSHGYPIQYMAMALGHRDGVCNRGEMILMEI